MRYAVVNPDNTFSFVVYDDIKQTYIDHHSKYNQKIVPIDRELTIDEKMVVLEKPTEAELAAVITEVPSLESVNQKLLETQLALTTLYEKYLELGGTA